MVSGKRGDRVCIVPKIRRVMGCGKPLARLIPSYLGFELLILGVDSERDRGERVIY